MERALDAAQPEDRVLLQIMEHTAAVSPNRLSRKMQAALDAIQEDLGVAPAGDATDCEHLWEPLTMVERHYRRRCVACRRVEVYVPGGTRRHGITWHWRRAYPHEGNNQRPPHANVAALWLKLKPALARQMGIKPARPDFGKPPWDDCKVAYGVTDGPAVWDKLAEPAWAAKLPDGWKPLELDGAGARWVIVFRVAGLSAADGYAVRRLLRAMETQPTPARKRA
jgi:hypothetical protein